MSRVAPDQTTSPASSVAWNDDVDKDSLVKIGGKEISRTHRRLKTRKDTSKPARWYDYNLFCAHKDHGEVVLRQFASPIRAFVTHYNTLYLLHYFAIVFFLVGCALTIALEDIEVVLSAYKAANATGGTFDLLIDVDDRFAQLLLVALIELLLLMPIACYHRHVLPAFKRLEPFSEQELLKTIFGHFPDFSFMISYCWSDDTHAQGHKGYRKGRIPRLIASWFGETCWIDIKKLIPGTQLRPAIVEACTNSAFRLAFVSEAYFASANCMVEWAVIDASPDKCIVFAYPCVTPGQLQDMEDAGHTVYEIAHIEKLLMKNSRWLLEALLSTRKATSLFHTSTPPMNEPRWYATLRFLDPSPGHRWIQQSLPLALFYLTYMALLFFLFVDVSIGTGWLVFSFQGFLIFFASIAPLGGLVSMLYYAWFFFDAGGGERRALPYVCHLLYLLKALNIIDTVPVYASAPHDLDPLYTNLVRDGIITLTSTPDKAALRVIDAEEEMMELLPNDIVYSKVGFSALSDEIRERLGAFIIGAKEESTSVELLAIKVLMCSFECVSSNSLTKGHAKFQQLKLGDQQKKSILSSAFSVIVRTGDDISSGFIKRRKSIKLNV